MQLPCHAGGHWTLLTLWRAATPEGQAEAEKIIVTYRDALPKPSAACQQKAHVALSLLIAAIEGFTGAPCGLGPVLPAPAFSAKQTNSTVRGYFCLTWMEEDLRLLRGEGVRRLPEVFVNRAADLSRWFKRICAESKRVVEAANAKAAQARAAKAASKAPAPLPPPASGPAPDPLSLPGPPVNTKETSGCSRCRFRLSGCDKCNPYKMAARAAKQPDNSDDKKPAEEPVDLTGD